MKKTTYRGVKGEKITIVEKQNKRIKKSQSASYGSLTFWKNMDFWQSVGLYIILISLLFVLGKIASLIQ